MCDDNVRRLPLSSVGERLVAFECGELDEESELDLLQDLIDGGLAWKLQGFYGRICTQLIAQGILHA